jgi:hypothetical protein
VLCAWSGVRQVPDPGPIARPIDVLRITASELPRKLAVCYHHCRATFIRELARTPATTGGSDAITQPSSFSDTYDFLCALRSCHLLCQSVRRRTDNYCPAPSSSDLPHHPPHADPLHPPAARGMRRRPAPLPVGVIPVLFVPQCRQETHPMPSQLWWMKPRSDVRRRYCPIWTRRLGQRSRV